MRTVLLPLALLVSSDAPTPQASFRAGKFAEAESVCLSPLDSYDPILLCGRIALLSNRLKDAESWLGKAHDMRPDAREPEALLAEVYCRGDRLAEAGALRRNVGDDAVARQLESFKGLVPYQIQWPAPVVRVPFIHTDPLPLIAVRVNDGEEVNLLIDTGGAELILDTEYAKRVGAVLFGQEARTFGGGKKAAVELGRVGSVRLGDQHSALEVKNVPVHVMNTQPFSAAARGKRVDGVLGTVFLYHFLFTLDYPKGELVLRPRSALSPGAGAIEIPFWMAGDHFMVAQGTANGSASALFFVDTGAAGSGFIGTESFLKEAGINPAEGKSSEGVGGGGMMKFTTFRVAHLSLGKAQGTDIPGSFGQFPASLEYGQGFRIAGIISHAFFRPYALTFDFARMKLVLEKAAPGNNAESFTAAMNKIVASINAGDYERLRQDFNKAMSDGFSLPRSKEVFEGLKTKMGNIQSFDPPRLMPPDQALFLTHFEKSGVMDIKLILDSQNRVAGLGLLPVETSASVSSEKPRMNQTRLRLPFDGRWEVMNGGDTRETNAHHDAPNQVYALDFVGVGPDGKSFRGEGTKLEDYYCFGRKVLAPAGGVVTVAISGVPDNAIGSLNPYSALGNALFIEHRPGEVSVLAHLKRDSLRVKVGDRVKAGQVLALSGNSGNSTRPHLHYHLQDTPVIQDGKGIKVSFQKMSLELDGKPQLVENHSAAKGEIVSPQME